MKTKLKKVTKTLAKEIAAKFFGRTIKPLEDIDETKRRVFYDDGRVFKCGAVCLSVFPYYGGAGKDFNYPNEYPFGTVDINNGGACYFKYVDGEIETVNTLHDESEELRDAILDIQSLLEDAIDENKINVNFDWEDKWIVKDKAKLLKILKIAKDVGDKY